VDRARRVEHSGSKAREDEDEFCPRCATRPRLIIAMLDSRKGKTVYLFECRCGERIWQD
jgi:hypothetical protein